MADRSRDLLFEDCGLLFVRRIDVEDTNAPDSVDAFLSACLDRLRWWWSRGLGGWGAARTSGG